MAAWTVSYTLTIVSRGEGRDFTCFLEYFRLAWTFRGGELPSFIWLFSILVFLPLAGLSMNVLSGYEKRKNAN
tara:strand:- start:1080 stop:1298 length:219 start_codon:yes stop_codon:yes gene_type:complete